MNIDTTLLQRIDELSARVVALEIENRLLRQKLDQYIRHYFGGQRNYHRLLPPFMSQPCVIAVAADGHAQKWKVIFRQNRAEQYYDPNWFSYGSGQLNTDNPNIGGDVRTGSDNL